MSEKITSTLDARIAPDVEARNRVQKQMEGLLAKEDFTAEDLEQSKALQSEFDGLTDRIQTKQAMAEAAADKDFTNGLLEETAGMVQAGDIPAPDPVEPGADQVIFQNFKDNQNSLQPVPMVTRLRGAVVADLQSLYDASPTLKEIRQMWMGQASGASPIQQDVIGRISGTGVESPLAELATALSLRAWKPPLWKS